MAKWGVPSGDLTWPLNPAKKTKSKNNAKKNKPNKQTKQTNRRRVNREVQTVNWEAGKEGAVETGVKRGLKKAHKPWIRAKNRAQTVN